MACLVWLSHLIPYSSVSCTVLLSCTLTFPWNRSEYVITFLGTTPIRVSFWKRWTFSCPRWESCSCLHSLRARSSWMASPIILETAVSTPSVIIHISVVLAAYKMPWYYQMESLVLGQYIWASPLYSIKNTGIAGWLELRFL